MATSQLVHYSHLATTVFNNLMALMRYVISLFPSSTLSPGANLRCFFVSPLLYSRSLLDETTKITDSPTVRSPITDTLAMVLSDSHSIGRNYGERATLLENLSPVSPSHSRDYWRTKRSLKSLFLMLLPNDYSSRFLFRNQRDKFANTRIIRPENEDARVIVSGVRLISLLE